MSNFIKPLQIACNQQVLEQNNKFHCIVSATMGVRLSTGEALLEFDFYKEAFEYMGDNPLPDMAMPKPQAEFIVSGSYYAPEKQEVTAGEVKVKIGDKEKSLLVFGSRTWEMGIPSKPESFASMPLSYSHAYGGNGYENNPIGVGYDDVDLPCIENPDQLLTSNKQKILPAGFAPLSPSWPQRTQFQGTYDESYIDKFFPGYPEDFDWRFFMTAAQDQWMNGFFVGNESFELHNLHPEQKLIKGQIPGYKVRCYLQKKLNETTRFNELQLNLDTVWFFPETDLALLIWRGGIEVADDEASSITDLLLAYESHSDEARSDEYYQAAMQKRLNSDDLLLNNFNTSDLIPFGAKSAMELMQENALLDTVDSAFSDNLDAKTKAVQLLVDEQLQTAKTEIEKNIEGTGEVLDKKQVNLDELLKKPAEIKPTPEVEEFNKKLEAILPGITAGDAKKLNLKDFSFNKIDEILSVIDQFRDSKQQQATEELEKVNKLLDDRLAEESKNLGTNDEKDSENIKALLAKLMEKPDIQEVAMPRLNAKEIKENMSQLSPQLIESMQQLQSMKSMEMDDKNTRDLEKMISGTLQEQEDSINSGLEDAEEDFKEMYRWSAHSLPQSLSPHKSTVDEVREKFVEMIRKNQSVSNMDWSCLDLSGMVLDGIDLSGAYLEQVDFTNTSLKGSNLSGAILARAVLNNADLSESNLEGANIGAVAANNATFKNAHFKGATLANGDFSNSSFDSSYFEDVNILDIKLDGADFTDCKMEAMKFIKISIIDTVFKGARLNETVFMQCEILGADYSDAVMHRCVWSNTRLKNVTFDKADMTSNCFATTDDESIIFEGLSFKGSCLEKVNFQGIAMPRSDFSHAVLTNANFSLADASYSNFVKVDAVQATFRKARLTHSVFDDANIMEGSMSKAHLSGASFSGANLYAVDFLRSTMGDTNFSGANLDNTIIRDWQPS